MVLPWHEEQWKRMVGHRDSLHHAVLITGQPGIGKTEFSLSLSKYLLCMNPHQDCGYCDKCQSCRLFDAGTHPDMHVLTTELESTVGHLSLISSYSDRYIDAREKEKRAKPARVISIDQVRQLIDRFSTHGHIANNRVALIYPADNMNLNAANALLKLLEEPPEDSLLILVTAEPGRLPATIRSRCVVQKLPTPNRDDALVWISGQVPSELRSIALEMARGSPLEAISMSENGFLEAMQDFHPMLSGVVTGKIPALELASRFNKSDFENTLHWMQVFCTELACWRIVGQVPEWSEDVEFSIKKVRVDRIYALYDKITGYRKSARSTGNEQLVLEDILLTVGQLVRNP